MTDLVKKIFSICGLGMALTVSAADICILPFESSESIEYENLDYFE